MPSPVTGTADILLVPNLDVAQMLVQQLGSLAGVRAAGLILGARVPIVLAGPTDTVGTLTASCALVLLVARTKGHGWRCQVGAVCPARITAGSRSQIYTVGNAGMEQAA